MAESQDSNSKKTILSEFDLDSRHSVLRAFLQFAQAEPIPTLEDWYTIPGNFDQILENFQVSHPQIWEALPSDLHYNVYHGRDLYVPMGPPSPEHEAATRAMVRLLLDKLQALRLEQGTSPVADAFIRTIERGGAEGILLDGDSKLCPDEQLASFYDTTPPIIIEVSNSQKFYSARGLKWKLSREIIDSLGNFNIALGLKIHIKQTEWNPCLTLYRPHYKPNPTGTGGTIKLEEIFEQEPLTGPNASQDSFALTLRDFISKESGPAILAQFPGLQNELDLPILITLSEVAVAIAGAKSRVEARYLNRAAISPRPTSGSLNLTKEYPDICVPDLTSDTKSLGSSSDDGAVPGAVGEDEKGDSNESGVYVDNNFNRDMEGVGVLQRSGRISQSRGSPQDA